MLYESVLLERATASLALAAAILAGGCAPSRASGPPSQQQAPEPAGSDESVARPTPDPQPLADAPPLDGARLILRVSDASNGWTVVIQPNGRFDTELTWEAGDTSFRTDCAGTRPPEEALSWIERVRTDGTDERPPFRHPPAAGRNYSLEYEQGDGTTLYLSHETHTDALQEWAGHMTSCA